MPSSLPESEFRPRRLQDRSHFPKLPTLQYQSLLKLSDRCFDAPGACLLPRFPIPVALPALRVRAGVLGWRPRPSEQALLPLPTQGWSRMRWKHPPWRPRRGERASSSWLASRPSFDRRRCRDGSSPHQARGNLATRRGRRSPTFSSCASADSLQPWPTPPQNALVRFQVASLKFLRH